MMPARFRALLAASALLSSFPSVARPASNIDRPTSWVGLVRCELQVEARGYLHQETHLWSISATSSSVGGTENRTVDTAWAVTGQGWSRRKDRALTYKSDWTINGQRGGILTFETNASTGVVTVRVQPPIPSHPGALTGTTQTIDGDAPRNPTRLASEVQAWVFDPIPLRASVNRGMANSISREMKLNNRGPSQPPEAKVTLNVAWSFAPNNGSAPAALPPPTVVPRAPTFPDGSADTTASSGFLPSSPANPSSAALEARVAELERRVSALEAQVAAHPSPSGGTALTPSSDPTLPSKSRLPTTLPSSGLPDGPVAVAIPAIKSVTPAGAMKTNLPVEVTIVSEGTHFASGLTRADFGAGFTVTSLTVNSPTNVKATLQMDIATTAGPRTITLTTGSEVVQRASGFAIEESADLASYIRGRYRVTATHVLVTQTFPVSTQLFHGMDNEIFFTADVRVINRRTGAAIGARRFVRTPIHGDIKSDPANGGVRVNAGTYAVSGGIKDGDDIKLRSTVGADNSPVVLWEGELSREVEYVLLRPVVWLARGYVTSFWQPYVTRLTREQAPDLVNLPAIRDEARSDGIRVRDFLVPQLTTSGPGGDENQDKPFGQIFTGAGYQGPGIWTDRAIILTREKIQLDPGKASDLTVEFVNTSATGGGISGRCTLFLRLERLP